MTPEQIEARCEEVTDLLETQAMVRYYSIDPTVELTEEAFNTVRSLYCEAMAKGLEMAMDVYNEPPEIAGNRTFCERCREQADKLNAM